MLDILKGPYNVVRNQKVAPEDAVGQIENFCPSTGKILCKIPTSGQISVNDAVDAARKAFPTWAELPAKTRGEYLLRIADRVEQRMGEIVHAEVLDSGKPIWEAESDVTFLVQTLRYYAGTACALNGDHIPMGKSFVIVQREPLGVVVGIGAWNYPFQCFVLKMAPAIICGNTFIFKPSELAPLSPIILAEICSLELPEGVVNLIQGDRITGRLLCLHEDVAKISFTGSVKTGQKIMQMSSENITKVTLELGGKSAIICFEDADLETALNATILGNFLNQGQVCSNASRVFVHESRYAEFTQRLIEMASKITIADPFDRQCAVGAIISSGQAAKIRSYLDIAVTEGARVHGGERVIVEGNEEGIYVKPAVITECHDGMAAVREEIFGPVCCVLQFITEEEAIKRANSLPYGLAAGIVTKNLKTAYRVASKLQAGTVWVNTYNVIASDVPFGGYKRSGFGRELGLASLESYTQLKSIYFEMEDLELPSTYSNIRKEKTDISSKSLTEVCSQSAVSEALK